MILFQTGDFTLRSGGRSAWKIECDALTPDDWAGLAAIAVDRLPAFGRVRGVPRGGVPFAEALSKYGCGGTELPLLIAEDVVTTGGSMERYAKYLGVSKYIGVCAFARGLVPSWVTPLFVLTPGRVQ